jgi:DNA-binding protein HU-beta
VNKSELIAAVAAHTSTDPKTVAAVLNGVEDVVGVTVKKGEKVTITGFVGFERVDRKARKVRNPRTGEAIRVKASKAPRLSAGASFKKLVNGQTPAPKLVVVKAAPAKAVRTPRAKSVAAPAPVRATKAARPAPPARVPSAAAAAEKAPRAVRASVKKSSVATKAPAKRAAKR